MPDPRARRHHCYLCAHAHWLPQACGRRHRWCPGNLVGSRREVQEQSTYEDNAGTLSASRYGLTRFRKKMIDWARNRNLEARRGLDLVTRAAARRQARAAPPAGTRGHVAPPMRTPRFPAIAQEVPLQQWFEHSLLLARPTLPRGAGDPTSNGRDRRTKGCRASAGRVV